MKDFPAAFTRRARRLLDRPFYGRVRCAIEFELARFNGLIGVALANKMLKRFNVSTLKRATIIFAARVPALESAGLTTLRESRVNAAPPSRELQSSFITTELVRNGLSNSA